jgi:hypothetical protein
MSDRGRKPSPQSSGRQFCQKEGIAERAPQYSPRASQSHHVTHRHVAGSEQARRLADLCCNRQNLLLRAVYQLAMARC